MWYIENYYLSKILYIYGILYTDPFFFYKNNTFSINFLKAYLNINHKSLIIFNNIKYYSKCINIKIIIYNFKWLT